MLVTEQLPGRTVIIEGKERLYFSGTSYLGVSKNTPFQQILLEGMQYYGINYSSSRSSNLQLAVYEKAEELLTSLTGAEVTLTFSSGYLAGQAAINVLNQGQNFIYAPETHPAVWRYKQDGSHGSYKTWALALPTQVAVAEKETVIVSNSLDPLLAEKYRFDWVSCLPDDKQITLLIDDSHGFGVTGKNGAGIYPEIKAQLKSNIDLIVVSSFGKAYGIPGGVVLGKAEFIRQLKKSPFFTAGSPIPPAFLYAFIHAQDIYEQAREKLFANAGYFQERIKDWQLFRYFDKYPVFYTSENALAQAVADHCILSSFPYPSPDSEVITRVVISSLHTQEDIDILSTGIAKYIDKHQTL